MKINDMRYVIEVSKWKSINKASQTLYLNQQQLSRIIAAVENDLKIEIFHRSPKGVFLTEQGEKVVKTFEKIVELYDGIGGDNPYNERIRGKIDILTEATIWTGYAPLYKSFAKKYPDINFSIKNMATVDIIHYLAEDGCVGLISRVINEASFDYQIPETLEFLPVAKDRLMVYAANNNPYLKKYKTISLATLGELPLLNFKPYSNSLSLTERVFKNIGKPNIKYEVSNSQVFHEMAVETDCLFIAFRKPKYVIWDEISEIPLRDKIFFENGILKQKRMKSEACQVFTDYYLDYYRRLY